MEKALNTSIKNIKLLDKTDVKKLSDQNNQGNLLTSV